MWLYNPSDLATTTPSGRLNTVRLLIGDTNINDPQLQDEEINFSLAQTNNNVYYAASFCCRLLVSKYSRMVDTQLDGALEASYSDRVKHYTALQLQMNDLGKKFGGATLGVYAGGISVTEMNLVNSDPNRVMPAFRIGQFDTPKSGYEDV